MNLHIVPDSKFTDRFYANLAEAGVLQNNRFVVRTNEPALRFVNRKVPFGKMYSTAFNAAIGDSNSYERVFIHQFTPLLYRWVALNPIRELNWCTWGADIYNLPGRAREFYEPRTWAGYSRGTWKSDLLYNVKLFATNLYFRRRAYDRVSNVLTWMQSEYDYVKANLVLPKASWKFFFYENDLPYEQLDSFRNSAAVPDRTKPLRFVLGNSGTDTNNHIDALFLMDRLGVRAEIVVPVSYGSAEYVAFLRKAAAGFGNLKIEFLESFLPFNDYVKMLLDSDGLIMNHLRPQGYGNILMMMYLDKPVYLNPGNISLPDLDAAGLKWRSLETIVSAEKGEVIPNATAVRNLLSHERLLELYRSLFS